MKNNNDEYRIYTRLELLINLRNQIFDRIVRAEVDADYFPFKAKMFKRNSPDYKGAMARAKEIKEGLKFDRVTLEIIDSHIEEEQAKQKTKKTKESN